MEQEDASKVHSDLKQYTNFLSEYAVCLLAAGVHTTRIIRNTTRIADSFDVKAEMTVLHKTLTLTFHHGMDNMCIAKFPLLGTVPLVFD